jgi:voltage-gated potassium channel
MKNQNARLISAMLILSGLILLGIWFFRIQEGWSVVDSFYFTVSTITTIGYGDLVPTKDSTKILTSFYALISIPLVISAFGFIAKNYIETRLHSIETRMSDIINKEEGIEKEVKKVESK